MKRPSLQEAIEILRTPAIINMKNTNVKYEVTGEAEDEIYRVANFINELQKVQDKYFEQLVKNLGAHQEVDEKTKDFLFDYIYNEPDKSTFGEFLDKFYPASHNKPKDN